MYLFFDGVSSPGYIAAFDTQRNIIADQSFEIAGNESTKTVALISEFLSTHDIAYTDIHNIVAVVGPGSFTGIRTISLVVNTLAYMHPQIHLTAVNFFDLYEDYPIVKSSSKRDLFVKYEKSATIEVVKNEDFMQACDSQEIYGDIQNIDILQKYKIIKNIDYKKYIQNCQLDTLRQVAPLYIKKPNIS